MVTKEISMGFGIFKIFAIYGIKGKFKISNITFPIYILIMTLQKSVGSSCISIGPGLTPITSKAPNNTAVVPEPGIPKLSKGTKAPLRSEERRVGKDHETLK